MDRPKPYLSPKNVSPSSLSPLKSTVRKKKKNGSSTSSISGNENEIEKSEELNLTIDTNTNDTETKEEENNKNEDENIPLNTINNISLDYDTLKELTFNLDDSAYEAEIDHRKHDNKGFTNALMSIGDIKKIVGEAHDVLSVAICNGDIIDVQMVLEDLGPDDAPSRILHGDDKGRTPLHYACLGTSSSSPDIIKHLLRSYKTTSIEQLAFSLDKLEKERNESVAHIRLDASKHGNDGSNDDGRIGLDPRVVAVDKWFEQAIAKEHRLHQFRLEMWWTKCMSARDEEQRTPIHYAASGSLGTDEYGNKYVNPHQKKVLEALLTTGFGTYTQGLPGRHFDEQAMYSSTKGELLGASGVYPGGSSSLNTSTINHNKNYNGDETPRELPIEFDKEPIDMRSAAFDLGSLVAGGVNKSNNGQIYNSPYDFEVIVPWVLRNMLKRATDLGGLQGKSGPLKLKEIVEDVISDEHVGRYSGILITPLLRKVLAKLGIRVTVDVLLELCGRYVVEDKEEIKLQWERYIEERKEEAKRAAAKSSRRAEYDNKYGNNNNDSGAKGSKDSDNDNYPRSEQGNGAEAKGGKDNDHDRGDGGKGTDIDRDNIYSNNNNLDLDIDDYPLAETTGLEDFTEEERNVGIDFDALLADIKSGKGLQTLDLSINLGTQEGMQTAQQVLKGDMSANMNMNGTGITVSTGGAYGQVDLIAPVVSVASLMASRRQMLNCTDEWGYSPLFFAVTDKNSDVVDVLLRHGADVSATNSDGQTPLSICRDRAVQIQLETALVKWLGMGKIEDDSRTMLSQSLNFASSTNNKDSKVLGLTTFISDLQEKHWSYSMSSLSWAVTGAAPSALQKLLEGGANPNDTDISGRSPLHTISSLLSKYSNTAGTACLEAQDMLEMLLKGGAQPNTQTISGRTPLHELFLRSQDDIASSSRKGKVVYHKSVVASDVKALNRARLLATRCLLHWGADPSIRDRNGASAVHYCSREDEAGCLLEILRGTDSRRARMNKELFKSQKSTVNIDEEEKETNDTEIAEPKSKSRKNNTEISVAYSRDEMYRTPLHIACLAGSVRAAQLLARYDADAPKNMSLIFLSDKQGKKPAQLLPPSTDASCLETLWQLARNGEANKLSGLLSQMRLHSTSKLISLDEEAGISTDTFSGTFNNRNTDAKGISSSTRGTLDDADELSSAQKSTWLENSIDAKTRILNWTPLHACLCGWIEARMVHNASFSSSGNINAMSHKGKALGLNMNPILASKRNKPLDRGVGSRMKSSKTPDLLPSSTSTKSIDASYGGTLQLILQNRGYVDALDWFCRTPLMMAAAADISIAVEILLNAGADVHAEDLEGNTALHYANAFGSMSSAVALESKGGDLQHCNHFGITASNFVGKMRKMQPLFCKPTAINGLTPLSSINDVGIDNKYDGDGGEKKN